MSLWVWLWCKQFCLLNYAGNQFLKPTSTEGKISCSRKKWDPNGYRNSCLWEYSIITSQNWLITAQRNTYAAYLRKYAIKIERTGTHTQTKKSAHKQILCTDTVFSGPDAAFVTVTKSSRCLQKQSLYRS